MAGRHGKGAALAARLNHGAKLGTGVGRTGSSYAIPTKDSRLRTLPVEVITRYVNEFLAYAKDHSELMFDVTRVGCGLAGYKDSRIAPLFRGAPSNCTFAREWEPYVLAPG
jgi:hypothetical protein